ncbi:MAG: hypothetical protein COB99_06095 [Sulfurimonas sp.]|nr:MAG: hypothetical protein COB99_06095 [Sulfurimonas sp.]
MIAITKNILKEYYKFKNNISCNFGILEGFFLNFQPFVVSINQLQSIGYETSTIMRLIQEKKTMDKLNSRIINVSTQDELIQKSKLKLLLTETEQTSNYLTINILENTNIRKRYTGSYEKGESRTIAKKHIKQLLEDESNIKIYDTYMSLTTNYQYNINLLKFILPRNAVIKLYMREESFPETAKNNMFKNALLSYRNDLAITCLKIDSNIHDRYIKSNNQTILLTSGLRYLQSKTKDFTYVVSVN